MVARRAATAAQGDAEAISRALRSWTSQLIDTGGRNRLLYFKHLKRGTLDLGPEAGADSRVTAVLRRGQSVKLSACFPDDDGADASQRARWILRKAREHEEEQGIRTLYLGWHFATWEQSGPGPATPNAPLMLAAAELTPQGRMGDDFTLSVSDDWEVNPSLAALLKREFGAEIDTAALDELLQAETLDKAAVIRLLRRAYAEVPGFDIHDGLVLGTFSYAKLPMVRDLEAAEAAVAQHPLVAAIAGNPLAQRQLRDTQRNGASGAGAPNGDNLPPRDEFLVLDADGTQSEVINAAVGGANLVVVGPPGTGKSQTIANLLATLTARGRSTLFVAEKRAAIDAVVKRLHSVGLGDLVLDLHESMRSRRQTAEQLANALQAAHTAHAPDVEGLQRTLSRRRETLNDAQQALHQPREPWGVSVYDLQSRILDMGDSEDIGLRARGSALNALHGEALEAAKEELSEYVDLGGAHLDASDGAPWSAAHRASTLRRQERVSEAANLLDGLNGELMPDLEHELGAIAQQLNIEPPPTMFAARTLLDAISRFQPLRGRLTSAVFEASDLDALLTEIKAAGQGPLASLGEDERTPWGVTVGALESRIQALGNAPESAVRLRGDALKALAGDALASAMADLSEYVDLGGAALDASSGPWGGIHRSSAVRSHEHAEEAARLLDAMRGNLLPDLERNVEALARDLNIEPPATPSDARTLLDAVMRFKPLSERFTPAVFEADDLRRLVTALEVAEQGPLHGLAESEYTPWGVTVEELDQRIRTLGNAPQSDVRLRGSALQALSGESLRQAMANLAEYVNLGGADLDASFGPWSSAHQVSAVRTQERATAAAGLLGALRSTLLPALERELEGIVRQLNIDAPRTIGETREMLAALRKLQAQQEWFRAPVFDVDAEALIEELQPSQQGRLGQLKARLLNARYRAAVRRTRELMLGDQASSPEAHDRLAAFSEALGAWGKVANTGPTATVWKVQIEECEAALEQFADTLSTFRDLTALGDADLDWTTQHEQLDAWEQERAVLFQLPRLQSLREDLVSASVMAIAREAEQMKWGGSEAAQALDEAWTRSVLDELAASEPTWRAPYRAARERLNELLTHQDMPTVWTLPWLREFVDTLDLWQSAIEPAPTMAVWTAAPDDCASALERFSNARAAFCDLTALHNMDQNWAAMRAQLDALERERAVLPHLPRLGVLRGHIESAAIADFASEADRRGWNGSDAARALDEAWTRSILDELREAEPSSRASYRVARARLSTLLAYQEMPVAWAYRWLLEFVEARNIWRRAVPSKPNKEALSVDPRDCAAALERFREALAAFRELAALGDADLDLTILREQLDALHRERSVLFQLPRLHDLRESLKRRGLMRVAGAVQQRSMNGNEAVRAFEQAWTQSVLEALRAQVPTFATFDAAGHDAVVAEFCEVDRRHIAGSPARVVRAWAEAAVAARDEYPEQSQLIMRESNRKRRHLPTRELFEQAPDVLTALKPCWVMSPLVVAQLLPLSGEPPFDVVVFDEASQIPPADAVSSLLRGRQAIVAGDPKQLPPTAFFTSSSEDEDEENEQDALLTQDVESILDAMSTLLPMPWGSRTLGWHYRSKDERLIAFSNHHVYDRRLTTFPGALPDDCLAHVEVPFEQGASWVSGSYSPEVERVVELILSHARERPDETLGVIALGANHANRIAETLRMERRKHPEFDDFFSEAKAEPFFVKNLERVQGDERDAIILTVGYGRTADGRMRYNFGPINQAGGFRRLNVAVTRAKRRMTVVSCFSADDMDPDRVTNQGVRMLRDYIEYASGNGRNLGSGAVDAPPLNPFEIDIKKRLEARGLALQTQYGVSGYRIDFAVMHPDEPGRPILAIEADGAQYHSAQATRDRDRLRQENLERLGWRFHRIWSTEWFHNPEREADRAAAAYQQALAADRGRESPSAAPLPPMPPPPDDAPQPAAAPQREPRPEVSPGRKIDEYAPRQLIGIVLWIKSDGRLRTEEELLTEAMQELGFKRKGTKIVAAIQAAIKAAR